MGRLSSIHRRDGAPPADSRVAYPATRLRGDGALASVDRGPSDRDGHRYAYSSFAQDAHTRLTHLLSPLHERPDRLAARLLHRFGSIGRIAQASENDLRQIARRDETWIDAFLTIRWLMLDGMREKLTRTSLGDDRDALFSYLLMTMQHLCEERMLAIFGDRNGNVIAEEIIAEGADAHVLLTPRRIFGRALNLNARSIILAHNHPSGCAEPSLVDIEHTRLLSKQAADLGLILEDHLVVGARTVTSMKSRSLF